MTELGEALAAVKELRNRKQEIDETLSNSYEQWKSTTNAQHIERERLKGELDIAEAKVRLLAIEQYKNNPNIKKLEGGVGIREMTKLEYDLAEAMDWAEENCKIAIKRTLDKGLFEEWARKAQLPFVSIKVEIQATIPKEIE